MFVILLYLMYELQKIYGNPGVNNTCCKLLLQPKSTNTTAIPGRSITKVKAKIDSLYPKASNFCWGGNYTNPLAICLRCNCSESDYTICIRFDSNANILNKDYFYLPIKDLPDPITNNLKLDTSLVATYFKKSISKNGKITYSVYIAPSHGPDTWYYIWKFTDSGELISKVKQSAGVRYD